MEKASVSVKIYNSTYALTTSASEEQVLKIAAEVDRRMQELAESKKLLSGFCGVKTSSSPFNCQEALTGKAWASRSAAFIVKKASPFRKNPTCVTR